MSRIISDYLPEPLCALLDGDDLAGKEGETFLLLTVDEAGWPHVALLSVGEVVARSPRELRLALWPGTGTGANLARGGRATLAAFHAGSAYYATLRADRLADLDTPHGPFAHFRATVREVRADTVDYADLLAGIQFRLKDQAGSIRRWREVVDALRAAP
jgi:hypothetical protein